MKYLIIYPLLLLSFFVHANTQLPDNAHISIVGKAQLKAKPDIVEVSLKVESLKIESAAAKKDVDDRVNDFLGGLTQFNIDEENVSASNISTQPKYHYSKNGEQILDGYLASRTLTVSFEEIDNLNTFLDFALSVEINQITHVEFKSSKEQALQNEVLTLAVENAKQSGEALASAFGAKLGGIYSIGSSSNHYRNAYGANDLVQKMAVSSMAPSEPSKPGKYLKKDIVFSASVSAVFDLED